MRQSLPLLCCCSYPQSLSLGPFEVRQNVIPNVITLRIESLGGAVALVDPCVVYLTVTTLREFLQITRKALTEADVLEPYLEAEVMLTDVLQIPRHRLYTIQDQKLSVCVEATLSQIVRKRLKREPLAYILGHREFYGIDLLVGPQVMVPRQETELLVERAMLIAMKLKSEGSLVAVDVGTGHGGIGINLALQLPWISIIATDVSPDALDIARLNIARFKVGDRITLKQGNLLEGIEGPIDLIVGNLPYIPGHRIQNLQPEVRWEPRIALDGGFDGLDIIRRLLCQSVGKLAPDGAILLEIDHNQSEALRQFGIEFFPGATIHIEKDFEGLDRIFILER